MSKSEQAATLLEDIASNLSAEGYDVYVRPQQGILPAFMAGAAPDAIALGKPKNLAIIVDDAASARARIEQLSIHMKSTREWDLRVYSYKPSTGEKALASSSVASITAALAIVRKLHELGLNGPALLMAWATFESLARSREPTLFARPQTPGRLIEILAADGRATPTEADLLRRLAQLRNRLVHGDLDIAVAEVDVQKFVDILSNLAEPENVAAE